MMTKKKCIEKIIFMVIAVIAFGSYLITILYNKSAFNETAFMILWVISCGLYGVMIGKLLYHAWSLKQYKDK